MKTIFGILYLPVTLLSACSILLMMPIDDENVLMSVISSFFSLSFALAFPVFGIPARFCCFAVMLVMLFYLSARGYSRFRREFASSAKKSRIHRIRCEARTFYCTICLLCGGIIITFAGELSWIFLSVPVTVLLLVLAFRAVTGRILFVPVRDVRDVAAVESGMLRIDSLKSLFERTVAYLEEKKPYANSTLSEAELARRMGVTARELSRAISLYSKDNYPVFIKKYRISYALNLIARDPHMKVTEVGRLSGFQSESSFTGSFKEIVGMTPSEYMRHERYRQKKG